MMSYLAKNQILVLVFIFIVSGVRSQTLSPCGTSDFKSEWLTRFQQDINSIDRTNDTLKYIPLSIHILGSDSGTGYFKTKSLLSALCQLNTDYIDANIQFYVEGDIHYLNNSAYFTHASVLDGAEMMFEYNIENTINCYILSNPAGNCGYNLPYAGIALAKSCTALGDHTWAHEMGHNLSLPHPFLGWEGDTYDYNLPTPTTVTYDYTYFQDTLIIDTLIIDTTFVELLDGSNCLIAADGFCDTAPDYISYRWDCSSESESPFILKDPNEVDFFVDGTLYMGYANDECQSRFSEDQICTMHATLTELKPELLQGQVAQAWDESVLTLHTPENDSFVPQDQITLTWSAKENATSYLVTVSRTPIMSVVKFTGITQDTFITISDLQINKKHYWQIIPFNNFSTCFESPTTFNFTVDVSSNLKNLFSDEEIRLNSTLLFQNESLQLTSHFFAKTAMDIQIVSSTGKILYFEKMIFNEGNNHNLIPLELPQGYFTLYITDGKKSLSKKFIVQ